MEGLEYAGLGIGKGAGESGAGGEAVAAAAELGADSADVEGGGFGAEAEADFPVWAGEFFEGGSHEDALDGAEVVDEAFAIVGLHGDRIGEIAGESPGGDAAIVGDLHGVEEVAEEFDAAQGVGFVGFLAEFSEVDAGADEGGGDFVGVGGGALVLEGAGVGGDGDVKVAGDLWGEGELGRGEEVVDDFAGGGGGAIDEVDVAVALVGVMVVEVDPGFGVGEGGEGGGAEAFAVGAVDRDDDFGVDELAWGGFFDEVGTWEEGEVSGEAVFVEEADRFAEVLQGQAEGQGAADGVAVRAVVGEHGKGGAAMEEGGEVGE